MVQPKPTILPDTTCRKLQDVEVVGIKAILRLIDYFLALQHHVPVL